jgi:hypothetical protein
MGWYRRYRARNALAGREIVLFAAWLILLWVGLTAMSQYGTTAQVIYAIGVSGGLRLLWIWAGRPEPDRGSTESADRTT